MKCKAMLEINMFYFEVNQYVTMFYSCLCQCFWKEKGCGLGDKKRQFDTFLGKTLAVW